MLVEPKLATLKKHFKDFFKKNGLRKINIFVEPVDFKQYIFA